ncbi:hypothetical protein [Plantactinospora sp. BC1]|uniref:hypothetical protein n=1 Tax=Plantactinospora sp. BC1 TaxID=2108470 RepID=UPI00131EDEEB|nr:hypothetical protein [Plantactinospora sp. BC1]
MTSSVADIVAQLQAVRERLAATAVTATRAEADAEQARQRYAEAASGTDHPQIQEAITDIRTAAEKAARTARLLTQARTRFTAYSNRIAPGSAPDDDVQDAEMPSGERLVDEARRRGRKADIVWRKQMQKAEDHESTLKQVEDAGKAVLKYFRQQHGPSGTTSAGTAPPKQPQSQERPQIDNPVTAAVMASGAVAIAAKSIWNSARKQREKKRNDDQT